MEPFETKPPIIIDAEDIAPSEVQPVKKKHGGGRPKGMKNSQTTGKQCTYVYPEKYGGNQCRRFAVKGRDRCAKHGGKIKIGIESPKFKYGFYSKYFTPNPVAEAKYHDALQREEQLSLKEEISVCDSILATLIQRVSDGLTVDKWNEIKETWGKCKTAFNEENGDAFVENMTKLDELIAPTEIDSPRLHSEINKQMLVREKLVQSERKRLVENHHMISVERAMIMMELFVSLVFKYVKDRDAVASIATEIRRYFSTMGSQQIGPAESGSDVPENVL